MTAVTPAQAYGHPNFVDDVPIQGPTDEGMRRLACCYSRSLPQKPPCVDCEGPLPMWTHQSLSIPRGPFSGLGDAVGDTLGTNSQLLRGQSITNGQVSLTLRHDGDLVLHAGHRLLWRSGTAGRHVHNLWMDHDGNLRLTDRNGGVVWDNGAHGHKDAHARIESDGNLVVWDGANHQIWDAGANLWHPNPVPGGHGAAHTNFGGFNTPFNANLNVFFRAGGQSAFPPPTTSAVLPCLPASPAPAGVLATAAAPPTGLPPGFSVAAPSTAALRTAAGLSVATGLAPPPPPPPIRRAVWGPA